MGQYYKTVNLDRQEYMEASDYGSGVKLMEHCWLMNEFVSAVMDQLLPGQPWHGNRLVWAGDYMKRGLFLKEIKGHTRKDKTLYDCCRENDDELPCIQRIRPVISDGIMPAIIANLDSREFVKLTDLPEEDPTDPGWHLHPLPLLTCGIQSDDAVDFGGIDKYVGQWAGNRIIASYTPPENFNELVPAFTEKWI